MRMHRIGTRWVLLLMALALAVAACSGIGETAFREISAEVEAGEAGGEGGVTEVPESVQTDSSSGSKDQPADGDGSATELGNGGVAPVAVQTIDLGRDIIFTANLTVAVPDVAAAGKDAGTVVAGLGGFLFGQSTTGGPEPRSTITFKVQPEDFETALARLGSIGEVRSQQVSADDVTERIVDLQSRIATAAASVDRLRELLAEADDIETIVAVENELLERETQLEALRGALRTLEDQVSLATITLTLTEAAANPVLDVAMTAYPGHDEGASCPGSGSVTVDEGTAATVCFELTNQGDTWLTEFELRDPVLDLETGDLTVVYGDIDRPIEPGASIMLAAEIVPVRDLRARTTVSASAVDEDGTPLDERPVQTTVGLAIDTADPGGIPTFAQGFSASLEFLVDLGAVVLLSLGAFLPFVWVPVALWLAWRFIRDRRREEEVRLEAEEQEPEVVSAG